MYPYYLSIIVIQGKIEFLGVTNRPLHTGKSPPTWGNIHVAPGNWEPEQKHSFSNIILTIRENLFCWLPGQSLCHSVTNLQSTDQEVYQVLSTSNDQLKVFKIEKYSVFETDFWHQ